MFDTVVVLSVVAPLSDWRVACSRHRRRWPSRRQNRSSGCADGLRGRCLDAETGGIYRASCADMVSKPVRKVRRDPSNN